MKIDHRLAMKPRFRAGFFWIVVDPGGVYAAGSRGRFMLQGGDIQRWLERLAPFVDGRHTLAELTARLDGERREKVVDLIAKLHERGLVEDLSRRRPHTLSAIEEEQFAGAIGHLAQYVDDAAHRFECYRGRRVLLLGSGRDVAALFQATLHSGSREITLAVQEDDAPGRQALDAALTEAGKSGHATCREIVHLDEVRPCKRLLTLARLADRVDAIFHVATRPALAFELARLCAASQKMLFQAVSFGEEAWIGPPSEAGSGWQTALLRRDPPIAAAWADALVGRRNGERPEPASAPLGDSSSTLVATRLVMRAFRHAAELDGAEPPTVTRIDLVSADTSTHTFAPHPLARESRAMNRDDFRARVESLAAGPEMDERAFAAAAARCVDERLGILRRLDERHFTQLPLAVTEVVVSDPAGLLAARRAPNTVYGASLEFATARHRAARRGLELYASAVLDPRRLVGRDPSGSSSTAEKAWLWGTRLDGAGECLVPVEAVFASREREEPQLPVGVASGPTWAAAVEKGLLGLCREVTVAEARQRPAGAPELELDMRALDPINRQLRRILEVARAEITVFDVTGRVGIPTFAFCLGDRAVAYAAGYTIESALAEGFEQILLAVQAKMTGEREYDPPPVPPIGARGAWVRAALPCPGRAEQIVRAIDALSQGGGTPVAVPLDHDPALASVLPYAARVLVAH